MLLNYFSLLNTKFGVQICESNRDKILINGNIFFNNPLFDGR